ncbi:MAG: deoxyribonuclease IV [Dehalococcoidia bacterium]|nr:deoxyribonuclease IV [Dehalococcoidia bacterium]
MSPIIVGAHVSSSGGIYNAIDNAKLIEAEAIQIFPSAPQMWRMTQHKPEVIEKFNKLYAASDLKEIWIHNIYLANLAADTAEHLKKSIDSVLHALNLAKQINANGVVLHTGSHKGKGFENVVDQVVSALEEILDRSSSSTILALEDMAGQGGTIGTTFEELGILLQRVNSSRLRVCLDTCHAFAAGYDIRDRKSVSSVIQQFDNTIGLENLAVIHANDSKVDLGEQKDRHENIGQGYIGTLGFEEMIHHSGFAGKAFILEVPGYPNTDTGKSNGPDQINIDELKRIRSLKK